jgi:hypothetical protein
MVNNSRGEEREWIYNNLPDLRSSDRFNTKISAVHWPDCIGGDEHVNTCACDPQCARYGDCCRSSPYFVPEEQSLGASPFTCMDLFGKTLYVMTRCPPDWKDFDTRHRCEHPDTNYRDPLFDAPVTSTSTNITYRNWHCASCHRVLDSNTAVIWAAGFVCRGYHRPRNVTVEKLAELFTYKPSTSQWNLKIRKYASDMKSGMSTQGTTQNSKSNNNDETVYVCDLYFTVGKTKLEYRRSCPLGIPVVDRCSENWKDTEVKTQCEAYTAHICSGTHIYRNQYCMLCNYEVFTGRCIGSVYTHLPFTALLDWKRLKRGMCASSEVYDTLSRVCRKVFTWETWTFHGGEVIDVEDVCFVGCYTVQSSRKWRT